MHVTVTGKCGNVTYRHILDRNWINIENVEGIRVRVYTKLCTVTSTDATIIKMMDGAFVCAELDLRIRFTNGIVHLWVGLDFVAIDV